MRRIYLVLAVLFAAITPLWIFVVAPRIVMRIPAGWSWKTNYIGYANWPDSGTNEWAKDDLSLYEREKTISDITDTRAVIKDRYTIFDSNTGKTIWEYITNYVVNPKNGMNIEGKDRAGYYYVFPLYTEKKEYTLSSDYIKKVPFSFVKEESLEGLETYLFEFKGVTEYTEIYQGTADFPGIAPPNGQEIRTSDSFVLRYWVEPVSGEIVKSEEDCPDGDLMVDSKTGKMMSRILRWGGKTTGDAVIQLVNSAGKRKQEIIFKERLIPAGFGILAFFFGIAALLVKKEPKK